MTDHHHRFRVRRCPHCGEEVGSKATVPGNNSFAPRRLRRHFSKGRVCPGSGLHIRRRKDGTEEVVPSP